MLTNSGVRLTRLYPVLMLILALSVSSCRTSRKMTKADTDLKNKTEQVAAGQESAQSNQVSKKESISQEDEETTTVTREYDTSQPADTLTGKPPLKKETTQTRRKKTQGTQNSSTNTQTQAQTSVSTQVQTETQAQTQTRTQVDTGLTGWQRFLCWLGGISLLVVTCFLVFKVYNIRKKRHSNERKIK